MFHAMATFKKEDPFVQVYAANENTIVHIGQLIYTNDGDQSASKKAHDGVMMTLMQFRSLMFHLRALDAQFMQALKFCWKIHATPSLKTIELTKSRLGLK